MDFLKIKFKRIFLYFVLLAIYHVQNEIRKLAWNVHLCIFLIMVFANLMRYLMINVVMKKCG